MTLPVFGGTFSRCFFEFFVEIVHIAIAYFFGYLIDLKTAVFKHGDGMFDTYAVHIGVEVFTGSFTEDLAKI